MAPARKKSSYRTPLPARDRGKLISSAGLGRINLEPFPSFLNDRSLLLSGPLSLCLFLFPPLFFISRSPFCPTEFPRRELMAPCYRVDFPQLSFLFRKTIFSQIPPSAPRRASLDHNSPSNRGFSKRSLS